MIYSIEGTLVEKGPGTAVVKTGGMSYVVNIPLSAGDTLGDPGSQVVLYTHLHVREDLMELYGFASSDERVLFDLLISVSGIGPRVALRILSGMNPGQVQQAIMAEDIVPFTRVSGVGRKIAERVVLELKGQVQKMPFAAAAAGKRVSETFSDAVTALITLGYKRIHAVAAVNKVLKDKAGEHPAVEAIVKEALRHL